MFGVCLWWVLDAGFLELGLLICGFDVLRKPGCNLGYLLCYCLTWVVCGWPTCEVLMFLLGLWFYWLPGFEFLVLLLGFGCFGFCGFDLHGFLFFCFPVCLGFDFDFICWSLGFGVVVGWCAAGNLTIWCRFGGMQISALLVLNLGSGLFGGFVVDLFCFANWVWYLLQLAFLS